MPKDEATNMFISSLGSENRWIGLSDADSEDNWVFEDGQTLTSTGYSNWLQVQHEPNGGEACRDALGMESGHILDDDITASSRRGDDYKAQYARLKGNKNWAAKYNWIGQWLQVDLTNVKRVTGTMIQGSANVEAWVKYFTLQYGVDENSLVTYRHNDGIDKFFKGNTNKNTQVTNLLDHPVDARYVRFYPQLWFFWISMRVEILGCDRENFTVCPEPPPVPNTDTSGPECICPYWPGKNCTYKCITGGDVIMTCGNDATTPQLSSASQLPTAGAPNDTSQAKVKKERKTVLKKIFEDPSAFKSKLATEDNATQEEWNGWKTGKNMPQGYDSNVSPQTEEKFDVTSAVKILHVGPLSEENANLSVTVEYSMGWVDARLRGLSTGWEPVPASFMWAPPLAFDAAVRRAADVSKKRKSGGRGGSDHDISMWLHPSGILFHRLTRTLYLSCVPSMARYPLDQQECSFKLHGYSGLYFPVHRPKNASSPGPVTTDMTAVVSQFELTGLNVYSSVQQTDNTEAACHLLTGKYAYSADHCTHMRGCSHGNECAVCKTYFGSCQYESNDCNRSGLTQVSTLEVRLQFSRRLQSHVLVTFLPTTSVVMTSWLGFWLHPQEINGRVSLGISTLLSLIIKSSYGENPQTNLVRAYDVWMSGCLAMVMLALLETVLANFILSGGQVIIF
ncbi:PREDICTED: uncharacterized protein LOC109483039 [Branchiostoma belcheri]|uniref:Uncharacterized protein LOC109483039 n=1 Tax=Branchiostoma belcheri TaxID=7741 RepID=A0A6P4ZK10_BRABE|nr:PREDICTED: uncharacterized protein LOC109483039 [Branchiostoma belcheri]